MYHDRQGVVLFCDLHRAYDLDYQLCSNFLLISTERAFSRHHDFHDTVPAFNYIHGNGDTAVHT